MPAPHRFPVTVFYEDTDFSGVVYYANYLKFFERARSDFFGLGLLVRMYQETGVGFAVYRADLGFREGARFGDVLEISTVGRRESDYRVVCLQQAFRAGTTTKPLVTGTIELVCTNAQNKLVALPPLVVGRLEEWNRG